jgi:hypothetical protein
VPFTLFPNQQHRNFATSAKAFGKIFGIGLDYRRGGRKLPMLATRIIDWEGEFTADCNKATRDVRAWNWARIPCIQKKEERFQSNAYHATFICHDTKPFIEVTTEAFNNHCIVIVPRDDMGVNLEEI